MDGLRLVVVDVREPAVRLARGRGPDQIERLLTVEIPQREVPDVRLPERAGVGCVVVTGIDADEPPPSAGQDEHAF